MEDIVHLRTKIWISRVSLIVALIIIAFISIKNRINYNKYQTKLTTDNPQSVYKAPKWLKLWSTLLFISCIFGLFSLISSTIPIICQYTYYIFSASVATPHILLAYFQIGRLHLCFSRNTGNKSISYPPYLFKILYLIGIPLFLYTIIYQFFTMESYELHHGLGCSFEDKFYFSLFNYAIYFAYLLWDWTIVGLYIYKLVKIKKTIRGGDDITMDVMKKIDLTLSRILFLTLIAEIAVFPILVLDMLGIMGRGFGWSLDFVVLSGVMYFMLEHNTESYLRLLLVIKILGIHKCCCCCFDALVSSFDESERELNDIITAENSNVEIVDNPVDNGVVMDQLKGNDNVNADGQKDLRKPTILTYRSDELADMLKQMDESELDQTVMDLKINKEIYAEETNEEIQDSLSVSP